MLKQQEQQEGEHIVQQLRDTLEENQQAAKEAKKRRKQKLKKFNSWRKQLEAASPTTSWRLIAQQSMTAVHHLNLEPMSKFHIIMVFLFCRSHFCLSFNCFFNCFIVLWRFSTC